MPSRPLYSPENPIIDTAAAQIVGNCGPDFRIGWIGISVQEGLGGHDHAGDTKTALDGMFFHKGLLKGMEIPGGSQAFQGGNLTALNGTNRQTAGGYGLAVDQDRAGPALFQTA